MVAWGAVSAEEEVVCLRRVVVPLDVAEDWEESSGAKADARREETSVSDQVFDMLSWNRDGSSTTKTSDSLRRPRCRALFSSSFLRMWPRPSASPVDRNS